MGANSFSGGLELITGTLNFGNSGAAGSGPLTIAGGTVDNVSGAPLTLGTASYSFPVAPNGTVTFTCTSNLDLGSGAINITTGVNQFWNVVQNTLSLEGDLAVGNATITKIGNGTLVIAGIGVAQSLQMTVNQGEVDLNRIAGVAFGNGGGGSGFICQSNAVVKILPGGDGNQIFHGTTVTPTLNVGGVFDLNAQSQTVDGLIMSSGVLRNSAIGEGSPSALTIAGTGGVHVVSLTGLNNLFDVPSADGELDVVGEVAGSGSLIKTGLGIVKFSTNSYTGNTVVSNGTFVLNFPNLSTNSTVTVGTNSVLGTNGVLSLNFSNADTNTVAALVLGGVSKPAGIYNATTDPLYITGSGSLQVVPLVTINPLPGPIQFSVSGGNTLALSWPTNLGWILQSQTNALSTGLTVNSNSWFDVTGSASVTSTNIPINTKNPTVFFRLRHP
jgi:autotransporter-associated beta strand protein